MLAQISILHRWVTERMTDLEDTSSDTPIEETEEQRKEQDDKIEMTDTLLEALSQQYGPSESASLELGDAELSRMLHQYQVSSDSDVLHFMSKQADNRAPPPRSLSKRVFDDPDTTDQDARRRKSNHAPRPSAGTFPEWNESASGEANRDPAWRTAPSWRRGTGSDQPDQTGGGSTSRGSRSQFIPGSTGASLNDPWRTNTARAGTQSNQLPIASAFGHSDAQTERNTLVFKDFPSTKQPASENQSRRQSSRQPSHVSGSQDAADDSGICNFDELLNLADDHLLGDDHVDSPMGDDPPDNPPTDNPPTDNPPTDNPPTQPQPSLTTAPTTGRRKKSKRVQKKPGPASPDDHTVQQIRGHYGPPQRPTDY
jgi:hypothetical protein